MLDIDQCGANHRERRPLAAEQELVQVGVLAEDSQVLLPDVAHPRAAYKIGDQCVELAKAVRHARAEPDLASSAGVFIQKIVALAPDGLQLPERHHTDNARIPRGAGPSTLWVAS